MDIMEEMQEYLNRSRGNEKRLLRFRGETYCEGDVIVLCEPSDLESHKATLLLVTWDEEFGITELLPLRFATLRVLNPEKWKAVLETLDKLRNPLICVDPKIMAV